MLKVKENWGILTRVLLKRQWRGLSKWEGQLVSYFRSCCSKSSTHPLQHIPAFPLRCCLPHCPCHFLSSDSQNTFVPATYKRKEICGSWQYDKQPWKHAEHAGIPMSNMNILVLSNCKWHLLWRLLQLLWCISINIVYFVGLGPWWPLSWVHNPEAVSTQVVSGRASSVKQLQNLLSKSTRCGNPCRKDQLKVKTTLLKFCLVLMVCSLDMLFTEIYCMTLKMKIVLLGTKTCFPLCTSSSCTKRCNIG